MNKGSRWQLATAVVCAALGCGQPALSQNTDGVRMTWFGITNWYYEIADLGIIVDGTVSRFSEPDAISDEALVATVQKAIDRGNGVDMIFVGHEHDDHSFDTVAWAKVTGAPIYTSKVACDAAIAKGLPSEQCTPVFGGEIIPLGDKGEVRVVRWSHSFGCEASSEGGTKGIETFAFLFTVNTPEGKLAWFMSDTGAGHAELVTNRVVDGVDYGAPLHNLLKATRNAGIDGFPLWQGGPESRIVNQARIFVPVFGVEQYVPQHFGSRGGYNLIQGLHYPFDLAEMPKLDALLKEQGVETIAPANYFDAYVYDKNGFRSIDNLEVKTAMGLPATGPGPQRYGKNPRAGQMECDID